MKKSKAWVSWLDGFISPRLQPMSEPPMSYITPVLCIVLALAMMPLELVPFGVAPPAAAILLLALGITASDGLLLILGYVAAVACGGFLYYTLA